MFFIQFIIINTHILTIKIYANIFIDFLDYTRLIILSLHCIFDLSIYKISKYKITIIYAKNSILCCCVFRNIDCKTLT